MGKINIFSVWHLHILSHCAGLVYDLGSKQPHCHLYSVYVVSVAFQSHTTIGYFIPAAYCIGFTTFIYLFARWKVEIFQLYIEFWNFTKKKTAPLNSSQKETIIPSMTAASMLPVSFGWRKKTLLVVLEGSCLMLELSQLSWTNIQNSNMQC